MGHVHVAIKVSVPDCVGTTKSIDMELIKLKPLPFGWLCLLCAAAQALSHPYFTAAPPPTPAHRLPKPPLREDNPLQVGRQQ